MATDISPGMLRRLERTAAELGEQVETAACETSALPFEDDSFDLVFGHAVLHHLPDLDAAFREFRRVLRPGGVVAFAASRRTTATASPRGRNEAPTRSRRCGGR